MWDLETGAVINILTGIAAEVEERAAQAWRDAGVAKEDLFVTCESNYQFGVIVPSSKAQVGMVFIAPPATADPDTIRTSEAAKRLAFFTWSRMFMVYELCL